MKTRTVGLTIAAIIIIVIIAAAIWYILSMNSNNYTEEGSNGATTTVQGYLPTSTIAAPTSTTMATSTTAGLAGPGEHCGGNMLNAPSCEAGYHCAPTPGSHLPFGDVGGTCVADQPATSTGY